MGTMHCNAVKIWSKVHRVAMQGGSVEALLVGEKDYDVVVRDCSASLTVRRRACRVILIHGMSDFASRNAEVLVHCQDAAGCCRWFCGSCSHRRAAAACAVTPAVMDDRELASGHHPAYPDYFFIN